MRRTRLLKVLVAILLVAGLLVPSAATALSSTTVVKLWVGNNIMTIGGVRQPIDSEGTKPVIVEGRTLVPIRAVIEAFDGSVAWDATERKVTVTLGENALDLWIGKSTATLNGTTLPVDAANPRVIPVIMSGRTMLPLRFVSESLGIDVQYEATTKMITLTYMVDTTPPAPPAPLLVSPADGTKFMSELPRLSWLPATGTDASRVQILSSGVEVHAKSNLTGADYVVPAGILADGTFTWRVSVHNEGGWGPWSATRSFILSSATLPAAPSLLTPANQSSVSAGPVTLTWTAVTNASAYRVQVLHGTDQTQAATDITGTSYVVPSGVLVAGAYSWQVGAYADSTWSDWSGAWMFTVQANAPSAPRLLTPADQSVLDSNSVVLTWASVTDADSYRIQVLLDGTEVHAASGLASTVYSVPSGVLGSDTYSWQVAAHGSGGWSAWSGAYSFEARAKLTTSDIAKYVDRMVLIEVNGFEDGEAFSASGSGFFISSDGRIVTNYHVIDAATQGTVTLNGGQKYDIASVLGYNKDQDLAVVKIDGTGFPVCALGDSSKVAVGDPVVAIGSPLGIQNTVSEGIVSKLWEDGSLQITAPISPGSSGGALFNMYGEVIGVTAWKILAGESINGAVPVNFLRSLDTTLNLTLAQVFQKEYPGAGVLPAPVLVSPAQGAVLSTLTPVISWTAVPGATKYEVRIWVGSATPPPYIIDTVLATTSYSVPSGLLSFGAEYAWTVYAGNSAGWSTQLVIGTPPGPTYSPSFTVGTAAMKLATPYAIEPKEKDSFFDSGMPVRFSWSPVSGASYYTLTVELGIPGVDAYSNVTRQNIYGTSCSLSDSVLHYGMVYSWSIMAVGTGNYSSSSWAPYLTFSVISKTALQPTSPADYGTLYQSGAVLSWTPVPNATDYLVAIYEGTNVDTALLVHAKIVSSPYYSIPYGTLTSGEIYSWYICARYRGYTTALCLPRRFMMSY
jgi:S1-C subfamily serine protease